MKRFRRIYLELTRSCNLSCSFCPSAQGAGEFITLDALPRILDQLVQYTDEIRPHILGEPLLYPYFGQFLDLCFERNLTVKVTTNGTLLDREYGDWLRHPSVKEVNFSLQSFHPSTHSDGGIFMNKILSFCDDERTLMRDPYINFRIWNISGTAIPDDSKTLLSALENHYGKVCSDHDIARRSCVLAHRRRISFDVQFEWPSLDAPHRSGRGFCHGAVSHVGICANGAVVPCCLDAGAVMTLGNILTEPLSDIVGGERLCAMKDGFDKGLLVEDMCQRCSFIKRFER